MTTTTFEPTDLARLADPYPVLAELRRVAPIVRLQSGFWAVTGYDAAMEVFRQRACASTLARRWPDLALPRDRPLRWHQRGPFRGLDELVVRRRKPRGRAAQPPRTEGTMPISPALRSEREHVVRTHMASENTLDFATTMSTFAHPRYEIIPTGAVYDGREEVERYFQDSRAVFPDQRNELIALHHADDAVIAEFWLRGTHHGPLMGLEPTGKTFECRMTAFFFFEGSGIVCERVYFDAGTILRQLTS